MTASRPVLGPDEGRRASGGTVSHPVTLAGATVGLVYDARPWRGYRFGARRWGVVRRDGVQGPVQWRREGFLTRAAAVEALVAVRDEGKK